jgi:glucokinase
MQEVKEVNHFVLGVDIGGTTVKIGLFDMNKQLKDKWVIPTDTSEKGQHILSDIWQFVSHKIDPSTIHGIGFGVPGPVRQDIVLNCVNFGWGEVHIKNAFEAIASRDDLVIKVANDASLAAFGEKTFGAGRGFSEVVMITIGTGVGGGIIINHTLLEGKNGSAGELGHMIVDPKYLFPCNCGKRGCLETVASANGITRLAKYHLEQCDQASVLRTTPHLSAKKIFDIAKEGDLFALQIIDEAMDYLAKGLASILLAIDPDCLILGGGVAMAGPFLIDRLRPKLMAYLSPFIRDLTIRLAELGSDAGIYGAMALIE